MVKNPRTNKKGKVMDRVKKTYLMLMESTLIVAWGFGLHPPVSLFTGRMVTFHTERRKTEREE